MEIRRRLRFQVNVPYNFDSTFASEEIKVGPSIGGTLSSSSEAKVESKMSYLFS